MFPSRVDTPATLARQMRKAQALPNAWASLQSTIRHHTEGIASAHSTRSIAASLSRDPPTARNVGNTECSPSEARGRYEPQPRETGQPRTTEPRDGANPPGTR